MVSFFCGLLLGVFLGFFWFFSNNNNFVLQRVLKPVLLGQFSPDALLIWGRFLSIGLHIYINIDLNDDDGLFIRDGT